MSVSAGSANLSLFAGLYDRECVGASSSFKRVGLDGAEEQPVAEYSKGMKHRLALPARHPAPARVFCF